MSLYIRPTYGRRSFEDQARANGWRVIVFGPIAFLYGRTVRGMRTFDK